MVDFTFYLYLSNGNVFDTLNLIEADRLNIFDLLVNASVIQVSMVSVY